jgi:hypothetical protein
MALDDRHAAGRHPPSPGVPGEGAKLVTHSTNNGLFEPLANVLCADDFDRGMCGWMDLMPNFVMPGHQPRPAAIDKTLWGPTMLSNANFCFAGTHGSMGGTYSLKLATRPVANPYNQPPAPGSLSHAIKRLSMRGRGLTQIEAWFSYTPEQDRAGIGENDVRAFGAFFDVQDERHRYFAGVRYVNSIDGQLTRRWQYARASEGLSDRQWAYDTDGDWARAGVDPQWFGRRYDDGRTDGFQWIDGGEQQLVYNESDDKINWMYLRLTIDTAKREYVEMQCVDRVFDLRGRSPTLAAPYAGIHGLLNPVFWIEADTNRRVFLFVDSVVVSADH